MASWEAAGSWADQRYRASARLTVQCHWDPWQSSREMEERATEKADWERLAVEKDSAPDCFALCSSQVHS